MLILKKVWNWLMWYFSILLLYWQVHNTNGKWLFFMCDPFSTDDNVPSRWFSFYSLQEILLLFLFFLFVWFYLFHSFLKTVFLCTHNSRAYSLQLNLSCSVSLKLFLFGICFFLLVDSKWHKTHGCAHNDWVMMNRNEHNGVWTG